MNQEDSDTDIEILHKLGLTFLEAKVYSTLVMLEDSDVKGIARSLNVAKCEVYRAISSLEKLGLVEKMLTVPSVYKASSIRDASQILLSIKEEEYRDLKKKSKKLEVDLDTSNLKISSINEKEHMVISNGKIVEKRLADQLKITQKSLETISTWDICVKMLNAWSEDFERLIKNKVKIRVLTDKLGRDTQIPQFLIKLQKSPYFEMKYYKSPLNIKLAIRDRKDVNICCSTSLLDCGPNIWSNNTIFVQLAANCFEYMWNDAIEEKNEKRANLVTAVPTI